MARVNGTSDKTKSVTCES